MKKGVLCSLLICGALVLGLMGTNAQAIEILTMQDFVEKTVQVDYLIKTADNAIFLLDGSDSMSKQYLDTGMSRYNVIKKTFKERNAYFPDLGYNMGIYLYTPWKAVYPVQAYHREGVAAAIESLPEKPTGPTMLQSGLKKLESILKGLSGRTVVFIITDGTYTDIEDPRPGVPMPGKLPGLIAKKLAQKYDVCFVAISTADDSASQSVIDKVASVSPCSIGIPFSRFVNRPEYYSGMLFLVESTKEVVTVAETRAVGAQIDNILFGLDQYELSPKYHENLDKIGSFMKAHPDSYALLAGFSCNLGSQSYNLGLSKFRVRQVSQYLENHFNIDADRLVVLWYGKISPVGDNSTEQGRRLNRRVEVAVGGL